MVSRPKLSAPVTVAFSDQLGHPLGALVAPELESLYLQLLIGLELIAEGDSYPGYAMAFNEGVGDHERSLILERGDAVIERRSQTSYYWRTAVLDALAEARTKRAVINRRLEWVAAVDPVLGEAMLNVGRPFCVWDCACLVFHWHAEQDTQKALPYFQVDAFKALCAGQEREVMIFSKKSF